MCEAILKVYEEGLVKPLKTAIYQHREKADEQKTNGDGEELTATEEGEPVAADLEDEEDDDDEEVEVLDVGEVTEDDEEEEDEEEEDAEEPSVASVTSETSANLEADPAANP